MIGTEEKKRLASLETPFYYYDTSILAKNLDNLKRASEEFNYTVHYALKANSNDPILKMIAEAGFGADCVSGNEIQKALDVGFTGDDIVFAGVGKSDREIDLALKADIHAFNCESIPELEVLNERAKAMNKKAKIALRINPNVNAKTHHYITTGLEENKFGINFWELEEVLQVLEKSANLELIGLHFHIGSQVTDLQVFRGLCLRVNEIQQWFIERRIIVDHVNVGGGLGVNYEQPDEHTFIDFKGFFQLFKDHLELRPKQQLHFELGRSIVATCGELITKVLYVKHGINTNFAIVDAGMTELIRPALYQAYHKIESFKELGSEIVKYDVVGPICESSDCFGKMVELPPMERGDIIRIRTAGAYGEVMTSNYNLRDRVEAVYSE